MTGHRIAVLPGDGVGPGVIGAALKVIEAAHVDAELVYGDIGWSSGAERATRCLTELWSCLGKPATRCSARLRRSRRRTRREFAEELRGKGYSYYAQSFRLRRELNLHTCIRPCKAYPGNPLNYAEGIER